MPKVEFAGEIVECLEGSNLRLVLTRARLPLYNSAAKALNCRGLGTCGTCTVEIEGEVSERTPREVRRLRLPPHSGKTELRLACQVSVLGDLKVTKYVGVFGQGSEPVSDG